VTQAINISQQKFDISTYYVTN